MPDDAILVNKQQLETETMGFSSIDDKEIWIFRPKNYTLEDLLSTSAHELGHIIEGGGGTKRTRLKQKGTIKNMNKRLIITKILLYWLMK